MSILQIVTSNQKVYIKIDLSFYFYGFSTFGFILLKQNFFYNKIQLHKNTFLERFKLLICSFQTLLKLFT